MITQFELMCWSVSVCFFLLAGVGAGLALPEAAARGRVGGGNPW